jgi:hypothetical protein
MARGDIPHKREIVIGYTGPMAVYHITACFAGITCRFIRQLMPAPIKISLIIKAVSNGIFVAIIKGICRF